MAGSTSRTLLTELAVGDIHTTVGMFIDDFLVSFFAF